MKKKMFLVAGVAFMLIYVISCSRQVDVGRPPENVLVEKAQSWFSQFISQAKLQDQFKQINYLWNKAKVVNLSDKNQVIAVPMVERNPNPGYRGIRFLYLYPWKNGKGFYSEVQEMLPDLDYTVYNKKIAVNTFSGYVARWDLEKGFSYGIKYKQGVAVSGADFKIVSADSVAVVITDRKSARILDPVTVIGYIHRADPFFYQVYIVPFQPDYNYFYNPCEYTNCNPVDINQYYTDDMLLDMLNAYLTYLYQNMETQNVKDSANDPCITSVLGTLQAISQSLPTIVNSTFGSNSTFNLTIKTSTFANDTLDAKSFQRGNTQSDFIVYLNDTYNSRTDLSTAVALMHEAMHAQMYSWYWEANMQNNKSLVDSLKNDYGFLMSELNLNDNSEHALMAGHYIDCMATALQQFATARGIDVDYQYCRDLAWGGLMETSVFKGLPNTDQVRISQRVNAENDPKGLKWNKDPRIEPRGQGCN